jgi:apolipoprotein N-acyltransferase
LAQHQCTLLLGAPAYTASGRRLHPVQPGYLLNGTAALSWYDKEHLVPFGGTCLPGWLPLVLVNGVETSRRARPEGFALRRLRWALVCYGYFPGAGSGRVQGANIVIISNDAWFGATSAPMQHLNLTALRAIEQGRWIVRSTNTGISAFIDPLGRIHRAGPQFVPLAAAWQIHPRSQTTVSQDLPRCSWRACSPNVRVLLFLGGRISPQPSSEQKIQSPMLIRRSQDPEPRPDGTIRIPLGAPLTMPSPRNACVK